MKIGLMKKEEQMRSNLRDLLNSADIKLVDIGARGGAVPQLQMLAPYSHYFACEPNSEEALVLPSKLKKETPWREITIITDAISSNEGLSLLNITRQPGLSSLLQPNYSVISKFHSRDFFLIESTTQINCITLDKAATTYGFTDACFLKVDTQGSELDILKSGINLLNNPLLGVFAEVSFYEFYEGQPLFSDVDSYLRNKQFSLFGLYIKTKNRAFRKPPLFSRGQPVWANALYLKEPESIMGNKSKDQTLKDIARLIGLALAFGHFDFALELASSGNTSSILNAKYGNKIIQDISNYIQIKRTETIYSLIKEAWDEIVKHGLMRSDYLKLGTSIFKNSRNQVTEKKQ